MGTVTRGGGYYGYYGYYGYCGYCGDYDLVNPESSVYFKRLF